jgi:choline-sulfatase
MFYNFFSQTKRFYCQLLFLILSCITSFQSLYGDDSKQPNILFLFADDLSYEALGYTKLYDVQTPNLDQLAARSINFTHAYNMGSFSPAVCVASRTMLVSGRTLWRTEPIYSRLKPVFQRGELWPQQMKAAGYETYFSGKWHVPIDVTTCFDRTGTVRGGMPADKPSWYLRPIEGQKDIWNSTDPSEGGYWAGGKHWSEVTADEACDFIQSRTPTNAPFFAYVAFNAPHDPRQARQEFLDKYPIAKIKIPESYRDIYPQAEQIGCGKSLRDERLAPFPRTPMAVQTHRREYFALITHLDQQIGRILNTLKQTGQDKTTWIFFTADHGLAIGNHGLMGKQNMYEHSLRVPLLIAGPDITTPKSIDAKVYLQDIAPTSLQIANATPSKTQEFQSLMPLIREETDKSPHDVIYAAYLGLQRAIIWNDLKLIHYPEADTHKLFDLKKDPRELENLINSPNYSSQREELVRLLTKHESSLKEKSADTNR